MTTIRKVCRRCYGHAISKADLGTGKGKTRPQLIAPNGTAHKQGDPGHTECGIQTSPYWTTP